MEFLSKSMKIGLESSWSIFLWNTQVIPFKVNGNWSGENPCGIPFKINGNWSGELLANTPIEYLRNSLQYHWKCVWRESLWNSIKYQWGFVWRESFWNSIQYQLKLVWRGSLWNSFQNQQKLVWRALGQFPSGIIPFNINGNWSGELLVNFPMKFLRNSFQYQWKFVWRESFRNSFQNQWKLVWRALRQFPNGILMEFLSISMEIGLESSSSISKWNTIRILSRPISVDFERHSLSIPWGN